METKRLISGMQGVPEGFELPKHDERAKSFAEEVEQAGNDDAELGMELRVDLIDLDELPTGERKMVNIDKTGARVRRGLEIAKKRISHGNNGTLDTPEAKYEAEYVSASKTWLFYVTRKA